MKLNNKGFAITAVLYGLLILFVLLVSSYLVVLSAKKNVVDNLINNIENEYNAVNLAKYIEKIYDKTEKISVTNNGISYNYATTSSLMNDRLGSMDTGIDSGNIRYYGADPNNYVYFNCADYNNPSSTTCEIWRIIGLFDDKVKIVKDESIGILAWDYDKDSTSYSNNWEDSSLQSILNNDYYNGDSVGEKSYYYKIQNGPYETEEEISLNFSNIGLKNDITRSMISNSLWYLAGYGTLDNIYANDIYNYERTNLEGTTLYSCNPFTIERNIGLINASDYGYASDLGLCDKNIGNYSTDFIKCLKTNWLYNYSTEWLISQNNNISYGAIAVNDTGSLTNYGGGGVPVYYGKTIRPSLYLNSNVKIYKGDGTSDNPYHIFL